MNLNTNSRPLAIKRARALRVALDPLLTNLALTLDRSEADRLVRGWIDRHAQEWEVNIAATGGLAYFTKAEGEVMGPAQSREMDDLMRVVGDMFVRPRLKATIQAALSGRCPDASQDLEPIVADAMEDIAPEIARDSPDGHFLARTIMRGLATLMDERAEAECGSLTPVPRYSAPRRSEKQATPLPSTPFLSRWPEFETAKRNDGRWKSDTASNAASSRKLFLALIGDKPASAVKRQDASEWRALLFRVPRLYDKARTWRDMSVREIIQAADAQDAEGGPSGKALARLKLATVDKHFGNLQEYWDWLHTNGHVPPGEKNPFEGFIQSKPKGRHARHERDAWPQEMVEKLFTSPVFSGCKNLQRRTVAGLTIYRDARFWVPLWGRLTGAREDEICSRVVGDIEFVAGIAVLRIRASKTVESPRDLPVPEALLRMGFLEHRYYGRDPQEPLFPELIPQGPGKRRSAAFSGWFTYYRMRTGSYKELVDFHSFRHNVSTDLQNMPGLNMGWADEITGHDSPIRASERQRYAKGVFMSHLKATLDRIDIGVELSHLDYFGPRGLAAPGAAEQRAGFVALAERDMQLKATRAARAKKARR
ncbi:tyrosine-type recombinase/integrase [Methylobacterium gregans]|uniref:tyrosine-type recombinase/integrase n=1 Tax=Methylobacterium gregans TaxID=374424 RepID=UPI001EE15BE5|nr:tyrosine-type recombinase/integrase [Methylobacterium gregans]MDQ0520298.1 integrase [Methylobacterium gregans]